jgi:CRP-like cAMP-binding protein
MFIALTIRDILFLRIILVSAQTLFIIYGSITASYVVLVWNALFLSINLFQVIVLYRRRRPVTVPESIRDIHENVFGDLSPREFLIFWNIGHETEYSDGAIVEEGETQDEVILILEGRASVVIHGREIAILERGSFIAEMSFLSGDPASANVICRSPIVAATWNHVNLRKLKSIDFGLWSKVQHAFSRDLVGKVRATSNRIQRQR